MSSSVSVWQETISHAMAHGGGIKMPLHGIKMLCMKQLITVNYPLLQCQSYEVGHPEANPQLAPPPWK